MTKKSNIKKFEEMFDLNLNKNNDQAEEYGDSTETEEPFDNLAGEMQKEIDGMSDKGSALAVEDPHDIVKDVCSKGHDFEIVEQVEEQKQEMPVEEDDFDELPEQEISTKEVVDEVNEVHEKMEEESRIPNKETVEAIKEAEDGGGKTFETVDELIEELDSDEDIKPLIVNDKIQWYLKSSSDMYNNFYVQKRTFLDICIYQAGGQIEYTRWTKELEEAEVSVVSEVFDQQVIIRQMEDVQQHRNRVKYIGVRVNNQYYLFERFISLLRGCLAKIQYLKPILKQEGLILEHMKDIELYSERLKALHNSVSTTEKNLAATYEMLSRKVTICMELPPVERYEKPDRSYRPKSYVAEEKANENSLSEGMHGYDDLPNNAMVSPKVDHKKRLSGEMSWADF